MKAIRKQNQKKSSTINDCTLTLVQLENEFQKLKEFVIENTNRQNSEIEELRKKVEAMELQIQSAKQRNSSLSLEKNVGSLLEIFKITSKLAELGSLIFHHYE